VPSTYATGIATGFVMLKEGRGGNALTPDSGRVMLLTMQLSDDARESMWSKLVDKNGSRAPRDVVSAFASLGGADAEAVYCTSYSDGSNEAWLIFGVDGDLLIYVSAKGPSVWRKDDDALRESLEAFTAPIRSYVTAIRIDDEPYIRQRQLQFGSLYESGRREEPFSPWPTAWVLLTTLPSADSPGTEWIRLPHNRDGYADNQHEKAEAVVEAVRRRLVGRQGLLPLTLVAARCRVGED
jgi:hypothetical protein